jgi:heat-inducible transcriptional repressor
LILVITSSGKINKTSIVLDDKIDLNDISTCIRIFNDRLLNTPVSEIKNKLDVIIGLVSNAIHKYEDSIQEIVKMIFDFNENSDIDTSIKGAS